MEESIFLTIRKMIGGMILEEGETGPFDMDLMIHINTALQILNQLGVGKEDYELRDEDQTWRGFLGREFKNLNMVKTYVYLKVRLLFDPPASSTLTKVIEDQLAELEWRLNTKVDRGVPKDE